MIAWTYTTQPDHLLIQVTTLGRLAVERDGVPVNLRRKDVLLLLYIALVQRPISRADAATLLWGETPERAARLSLRQAIWRLRAETGEAVIANNTDITVDRTLISCDVAQLSACVEAGRYREAVALWQGEFLAGADAGATNEFESWVEDVRARTHQRLSLSLGQLVRDAARTEDWPTAARYAARWLELAPHDSAAALELARALRASGKSAEALARLTAFSRNAVNPDVETTAEIRQLARELSQDATHLPVSESLPAIPDDSPHIQLITIWERVAYGRSACAFVQGQRADAARTCRNFLNWIDARGARTVVLRSNAGAPRAAFSVVRSLIDGLRNAPGLAGAPDAALAVLASWSSALRDRYPRLAMSEPRPELLADALRRVLEAVADEVPVVIYIERAEDCDVESATALTALMSDPPPRTLLLLPVSDPPQPSVWAGLRETSTIIEVARAPRRRWPLALAALLTLFLGGALLTSMRRGVADDPVAVGVIEVVGEPDSLGLGRAIPGLLASKLALIPALQVISSVRMHEVESQVKAARSPATDVAGVAKRAGARTLIEGEMYRQDGEMRLALRRVRLSSGTVEKSYEASGANVFRLVDEMADQIARSYHVDVPRQSVADVTTTSIVAYRFYEEGLRAFYQNDRAASYRVFRAALDQDSTFAMAAYYASQSAPSPDESKRWWYVALRLGDHASDHDRLLIRAQWAVRNGSHDLYALAETLTIRYPRDADGQYYSGLANNSAGRFMVAAGHFKTAVTLDSLALLGRSMPCRACEAIDGLLSSYMSADSLARAEAVARKWIRLQPWSLNAWTALGGTLEFQGRYAEAESAYVHAESVQPDLSDLGGHQIELAIRSGRFAIVDSLLARGLGAESGADYGDALWKSVLSYRTEGRLRAALASARKLRDREPDVISRMGLVSLEARVLMEMKRYREAALLYDSAAGMVLTSRRDNDQRGAAAWYANEAAAFAAMGDTSRLANLEQLVRRYGSMSVELRDRTLYHYVHALRRELAGDPDGAIASYQAAMFSPTGGNVRASLGLARVLVARGRGGEAIPILNAAVRGALGASGYAVTKTELHLVLAEAYETAGKPARAREEYAWVVNAWKRADPEVQPRRAQAQQRLLALRRD